MEGSLFGGVGYMGGTVGFDSGWLVLMCRLVL